MKAPRPTFKRLGDLGNTPLTHRTPSLALALFLALICAAAAANPPISIDSKADRGELEVRFKGRLLVYAFATNQFKPYLRELYTLRGENVLRDAPPDHLHHHGLMYAVYVNGINFWEERSTSGYEVHDTLSRPSAMIDAKGMPVASFTEFIHWLAPTNRASALLLNRGSPAISLSPSEGERAGERGPSLPGGSGPQSASECRGVLSQDAALLVEQRTLTVTVDEKQQEVALRWDSQFQVGPNAGKVTLHGSNYDGLGLRLPESFNHVARFQNSADQPYTGNNTQNVIPAQWTSVSGVMDGREVMLVMFGRPDNARGDGFFFTMLDPFAYLSATQGLDKKPLEYSAGDKFSLNYLLTVYSENKSPEFIRQRCALWDKERK